VYHPSDRALQALSFKRKAPVVGLRPLHFSPEGRPVVHNVDVTKIAKGGIRNLKNFHHHAYSPFLGKILVEAQPRLAIFPLNKQAAAAAAAAEAAATPPGSPLLQGPPSALSSPPKLRLAMSLFPGST
jgi:hypothetical protein